MGKSKCENPKRIESENTKCERNENKGKKFVFIRAFQNKKK